MKQTQRQMVIEKLKLDGFVTRNWALSKFCSRLGAIICNLKEEGWEIEGKNDKGDYLYEVKGSPLKKIVYTIPGMEDVEGKLKQLTIFR